MQDFVILNASVAASVSYEGKRFLVKGTAEGSLSSQCLHLPSPAPN